MNKLILCLLLIPFFGLTQDLQYSPNRKLDKTVSINYYNTEFIFIKNISESYLSLNFEKIETTLLSDWSATLCTNQQCYNNLPKSGVLGQLAPGEEAYISFNFAANNTIGEGKVRYLITSAEDQSLKDTVTFNYRVTEDGTIKAGPWAQINYAQGVLTVLLENSTVATEMQVYTLDGKAIFDSKLDPITSIPLRNFGAGIYLIFIRDEYDRVIKQKVVHYTI